MGGKKGILFVLLFALVIVNIANVSAIVAKLGGANANFNLEIPQGESVEIDRTITLINDNNEDVNVSIVVAQESRDIVDLDDSDKNFILKKDQDKDVTFKITIDSAGEYEVIVSVSFSNMKGSQNSGLLSRTTIFADGEGSNDDDNDDSDDDNNDNSNDDDNDSDNDNGNSNDDSDNDRSDFLQNTKQVDSGATIQNLATGQNTGVVDLKSSSEENSASVTGINKPVLMMSSINTILLVIFLGFLMYLSNLKEGGKKQKK